jgi:CRISPR-associated protein Csd1
MEVLGDLKQFPATLTLPQQGLFALGFYHQRAADRRAARERAEENRRREADPGGA